MYIFDKKIHRTPIIRLYIIQPATHQLQDLCPYMQRDYNYFRARVVNINHKAIAVSDYKFAEKPLKLI